MLHHCFCNRVDYFLCYYLSGYLAHIIVWWSIDMYFQNCTMLVALYSSCEMRYLTNLLSVFFRSDHIVDMCLSEYSLWLHGNYDFLNGPDIVVVINCSDREHCGETRHHLGTQTLQAISERPLTQPQSPAPLLCRDSFEVCRMPGGGGGGEGILHCSNHTTISF